MASELRPIDPLVWRAFAGYSVKIPTVGSRVYYFPQGHAEHADLNLDSTIHLHKPYLLSRVISVNCFADPHNDQPFLRIGLDPRPMTLNMTTTMEEEKEEETARNVTYWFSNTLTESDVINCTGFSVSRFLAESIFPLLDTTTEVHPVQNLTVRDLQGREWGLRHIYRGTPRGHLLTTGWRRFVKEKKLAAGDSVVFIKDKDGDILVGTRRNNPHCSSNIDDSRVAVVEAVRAAAEGDRVYEVDYYPGKLGSAEFVVAEEAVEAGVERLGYLVVGSKVRMVVEVAIGRDMRSFYGVVNRMTMAVSGPWAYSPWRTIEVQSLFFFLKFEIRHMQNI